MLRATGHARMVRYCMIALLAFANSIAYIVITMIFSVARASLTYDNDVIATTLHISNDFATDVFSAFDSKIIKLTCFPKPLLTRALASRAASVS